MNERTEFAVLAVLAVVGAAVFGYFYVTLPAGGVPVEHSKGDASRVAEAFLEERGYELSEYRRNTVFTARAEASTYLQLELSRREARGAFIEYGIRYWETRFYKPLSPGEFRVGVDPVSGEVIRFEHDLPDGASGANLTTEEARRKAEAFLRERGYDLADYELVKSASTDRPNRRDHEFVWQKEDGGVADAPLHVRVEVHGARIGAYEETLDVPDGFTHTYRVRRNRGTVLNVVSTALTVLLLLVAVVFGLRYYREGEFDARFGLALGGGVAALSLLGAVNSLPGVLHAAPTTFAPWGFVLLTLVGAAIGALVVGAATLVAAGTGRRLTREVLGFEAVPDPLESATARRELARDAVRGVALAFALLGGVTLFYVVGERFFDVWLPASSPYTSAMSTFLPAVVALTIGGTAALLEESVFRLFAIPLTKRYLRYTALAVVLPAVVWGLGHSGYAVLPYYTRAVEVTLVGIVVGAAFLRYGLVTVLAYHFSFNALLAAVPLLSARLPWVVANGVLALLVALLPLLVAAGIYAYDRGGHSTNSE